jgi:S-formylglutathione hydrolase FrmB
MGGYGTIRIGMKRPDVFSSLYIMSGCCLINNPGGQGNRGAAAPAAGTTPAGTPAAGNRGAATAANEAPAAPAAPNPAAGNRGNRGDAPAANAAAGNRGGRGGGFANTAQAQAAAWSPNPKNAPNFFDLPVVDGQPQPLVIAKFAANSPLAMVDQYVTNLKKYRAIAIEVGLQDTLAASNRQLDQLLTDSGIVHTFETYEGDHTNRVPLRIEGSVLPFFARNLSFPPAGR